MSQDDGPVSISTWKRIYFHAYPACLLRHLLWNFAVFEEGQDDMAVSGLVG
jgi:hypothetical protein